MIRNKYSKVDRALLKNQRECVLSSENDESHDEVEEKSDYLDEKEDEKQLDSNKEGEQPESLETMILDYEKEDTRLIDGVKSKKLARGDDKRKHDQE